MVDEQRDVEARVEALLQQMTLREKVSLLSGKNTWQTVAIERLGIPSLTMTDGPHGVRANRTGPERVQGPATSFPTGVSMAASWDPTLIEQVGEALAEETLAMGCDILLGPCVNIVRTPLAGRNFESYAEDPYLAGRIGTAWVKGLQRKGVGASLKHYACNNQEYERFRGSSEVDERTLREIYLAQFETIVKEARPWTVMCAYNRVNGVYASQHDELLNRILKEEWGFEGVVISDWYANHTTVASVAGGLDLEMPGPAKYYGRLLEEAVRIWQIDEAMVDEAVRRILRMIVKSGRMDGMRPEGAVNTPEHQALARRLAEASITLLKNEAGVLPLKGVTSLAVIGPNADEARIGGGGSSYLEPPYRISPMEGLREVLGDGVRVAYARGCDNYEELPTFDPTYFTLPDGREKGWLAEFFNNPACEGKPVATRTEAALDMWHLQLPPGVPEDRFAVRWRSKLRVPQSGRYHLKLIATQRSQLRLEDKLLLDVIPDPRHQGLWEGSDAEAYVTLEAGHDYAVEVTYRYTPEMDFRALYLLGAYAPDPDNRIEEAVALARASDAAVIFAGMPKGYETEGRDRPHMRLPGAQDALIRAVAKVNPRTVVVLNVGAPVEMPWIDDVPAVVLAYYPGQEGGRAVARVLTGAVNPSGKLPVTFPKRYEDNPTYLTYPGGRKVYYGEGIFVGYRYYDAKKIEPLFPFGHGLSYTTFAYNDLVLPERVKVGEPVEVQVTVTNTGNVAGQEVVQLYVHDEEASLPRPPKELKGFAKIALAPGESKTVRFTLDRRAFAFYDPHNEAWTVEPGAFTVLIGSSSRDIRLKGTFTMEV